MVVLGNGPRAAAAVAAIRDPHVRQRRSIALRTFVLGALVLISLITLWHLGDESPWTAGDGSVNLGLQVPSIYSARQGTPSWPHDVCGITVSFDVFGTRNESLDRFRYARQTWGTVKHGFLPLIFVELAFDDSAFRYVEVLDGERDLHVPLRAARNASAMWQKEHLYNMGAQAATTHPEWAWCKKAAFLDLEVIFSNPQWVEESSEALDTYRMVQPFASAIKLDWTTSEYVRAHLQRQRMSPDCSHTADDADRRRDGAPMQDGCDVTFPNASLVYVAQVRVQEMSYRKMKRLGASWKPSFVHVIANLTTGLAAGEEPTESTQSAPGFAWVVRLDVLSQVGFYASRVAGGGDFFNCLAFVNSIDKYPVDKYRGFYRFESRGVTPAMAEDYSTWLRLASSVYQGQATYLEGSVLHLHHGSYRGYTTRVNILAAGNFDPRVDIRANPSTGVLEWATEKPDMHEEMVTHFWRLAHDPRPEELPVLPS